MTEPPKPAVRLTGLSRYQPGRSAAVVSAGQDRASNGAIAALASNESPFEPLAGVVHAVVDATRHANRYPDHAATAVAARFAAHAGVDAARVAVGPGTVGLLQQLALAFVDPGDEVLYPWPSFIAYPQFTQLAGGSAVTVALRRETAAVDALAAAVTPATRLVLIANPNNPTSTALTATELSHVVDAAPERCLVVIDEAYREFVTGAHVPDAAALFADRPNVVVLRTLSKAYGLAGLRVGFAIAHPSVVDAVNACAIPFAVSSPAQAAALAALNNGDEVARRATIVTDERQRVARALRRRGIGVPASETNFWWLPMDAGASSLAAALEQRGVVTRPLDGGLRITVGLPADNDRFLVALDDVVDTGALPPDSWGVAAGANAQRAGQWLDRLDAAVERLRQHLQIEHPGRTDPVPGEDETWDAGQVWAHVAEFGSYWLDQLTTLLDAPRQPANTASTPNSAVLSDPPPFGRTRHDAARRQAIEAGRHVPAAAHFATIEVAAGRLGALLASMTDDDWACAGRHETLGVMDLDRQLQHFHVGHYEEHADQLDLIAAGVAERQEHR